MQLFFVEMAKKNSQNPSVVFLVQEDLKKVIETDFN